MFMKKFPWRTSDALEQNIRATEPFQHAGQDAPLSTALANASANPKQFQSVVSVDVMLSETAEGKMSIIYPI
jgi:hypothetical protein